MNIDQFKSRMQFGGARPNFFQVELAFPTLVPVGNEVTREASFLAKGAQLPGVTTEIVELPFRGRTMKLAGDKVFEEWTVTILNDNDFLIRDALEQWSNLMQSHQLNTGPAGPIEYMADLKVHQLDRKHNKIKTYTFIDAFPTVIAPIELSYDSTNEIEEMEITFEYQYWTSNTTT